MLDGYEKQRIINILDKIDIPIEIKANIINSIDRINKNDLIDIIRQYITITKTINQINKSNKNNSKNSQERFDRAKQENENKISADKLLDLI